MSPSAALSSETQAELLRKDGNKYFKKDRFGAAIDAYTEAITLCPGVPVYLTNRALCHLRRSEWTRVEEDCRKALQLDNKSVKGHYMLGLALLRKEEYADGIKQLERALDLGRGADPEGYMVDKIWEELSKAKFMEWEHESTKRMWDMQNLKEACVTALKQKHLLDDFQADGPSEESNAAHLEQLKAVDRVFESASNADTPTEVPDYLCCKINLEIFRDPVITPCGVTYERSVIIDHLRKVGNFDPITRDLLEEYQLIPNLAIKEAVQSFLQKHGWAYNTE